MGDDLAIASWRRDQSMPIIESWDVEPREAIARLTIVGIADAVTWAKRPDELSVGQRARWELACQLADDAPLLIVDEWLATLDRLTARAVAWASARAIRKTGKGAILVTSHDDLARDLQPDAELRVGWEPTPSVRLWEGGPEWCSVLDELKYRRGDSGDWAKLKHLHYAAGDPATVHSYHVAEHPSIDHPAAVAIVSYPDLHSAARNLATDDAYRIMGSRQAAQRLNREVLKLSRMVVTPELRGCGLAHWLMHHAVPQLDIRYLECVTAMGRYSSFLQRIGFREVPNQSSNVEAEWIEFASARSCPPDALLASGNLKDWVDSLSVRQRREARRLVWAHYHHFVLHRRTRKPQPKKIPGPQDERWPEAFDVACRRMIDRPSYWIMGPMDGMTGYPEEPPDQAS